MIDVCEENLYPLSQGPPGLKRRVSAATWWRWATKGVRGVRLETVALGGRRYTSAEALARFTRALNSETRAAIEPASADPLRNEQKANAAERASAVF
jgi:hypothetical protein